MWSAFCSCLCIDWPRGGGGGGGSEGGGGGGGGDG